MREKETVQLFHSLIHNNNNAPKAAAQPPPPNLLLLKCPGKSSYLEVNCKLRRVRPTAQPHQNQNKSFGLRYGQLKGTVFLKLLYGSTCFFDLVLC